jgi:hypothetical protein
LRLECITIPNLDFDAGFVLCEARNLQSAIDRHAQLVDPPGEDALDMRLPQRETVRVARWKIADVERNAGERDDLCLLTLREEPISDAALIEDFDRA